MYDDRHINRERRVGIREDGSRKVPGKVSSDSLSTSSVDETREKKANEKKKSCPNPNTSASPQQRNKRPGIGQ